MNVEPTTTHKENLAALNRIVGQVNGIKKMIEDEKYCIDIINQMLAVIHALYRITEKILAKHIEKCVKDAFISRSKKKIDKKISEIMGVIKRLRKLS
ncbi:MAG: metal-sensitive transcriptional regulator [bacterium]